MPPSKETQDSLEDPHLLNKQDSLEPYQSKICAGHLHMYTGWAGECLGGLMGVGCAGWWWVGGSGWRSVGSWVLNGSAWLELGEATTTEAAIARAEAPATTSPPPTHLTIFVYTYTKMKNKPKFQNWNLHKYRIPNLELQYKMMQFACKTRCN